MCINPSHIYVERGPKYERVPVPCKDCWRCRSNRVNDYVGRALAEAAASDWTACITLTYAPRDDLSDKVLTPRHFQDFIRSLRKRGHRNKNKLRYLAVGEYGDKKGRSHFHAILYGKGKRIAGFNGTEEREWIKGPNDDDWTDGPWPHGHVQGSYSSDIRAVRYICKYLQKNERGQFWLTLSKKPTLGFDWFQEKARQAVEAGVLPYGFEYLPPGGQPGHSYLMTGATRRDYLLEIVKGVAAAGTFDRSRMSEWAEKSLAKYELAALRKECADPSAQVLLESLAEKYNRLRPSQWAVHRQLIDGVGSFYTHDIEDEGAFHAEEWWKAHQAAQGDAGRDAEASRCDEPEDDDFRSWRE